MKISINNQTKYFACGERLAGCYDTAFQNSLLYTR
jgi:hypothetical protein